MNWAQFKDPVSHMCLVGAVVASWSLTQEVEGLSLFTVMTNVFVCEFSENIWENSKGCYPLFRLSHKNEPHCVVLFQTVKNLPRYLG